MGLDLVELTIRIEDVFSIKIPDSVAPELTTPREVTDFILTEVEQSPGPLPCLSQKAFHLLRWGFTHRLNIPRRQFRVSTPIKDLIPEEAILEGIGRSLRSKTWPTLFRPKFLGLVAPKVRTVKDLVEHLVMNETLLVKGQESAWSRAQVRDVLRRLIVDQTAITDFSEDSRFVQDMHLS